MFKAFKYRLYPNHTQEKSLSEMLETHRRLYNNALAQRKDAWEAERRSVTYNQQAKWLTAERKTNEFLGRVSQQASQATLRRLDKTFRAFFRRVKSGEKSGYPRFKGKGRFDSIEFPVWGDGCSIHRDGQLHIPRFGCVKVKWHRPIPDEARIKTLTVKREADGWHAIFCCEMPNADIPPSVAPSVGIDLGLKSFLVTSDGSSTNPPKFLRKAESQLRRAQRKLSRRKKGSNRRAKARQQVAKLHQHIANQRRDFHHKVALNLVRQYGSIVHEDLNIKGIAKTGLAKSTHDVGWGQFLAILRFKAEGAGVAVIGVDPRNTTQACSNCGCLPDIKLTLADRTYHCEHCGFTLDRDENAARNILHLGLGRSLQALTEPIGAVA